MEHLWKELIDCGIKSVGTPEKEKAEELLFQEFKKISPDAYKFEFTFEGWGSNEPSWLKMTSPEETELQTYLFLGSGNGRFKGELKYIGYNIVWNMYYWDRYAVYDNNKIVAYISGRPSGRLISQTLVEGNSELPHFIVDECNNRRIKELLEKNIKVTVEGEARTYTKADMRGCDLVLPLKAEKPQAGKIIICAHYDTMYNTKGAFDNGSGAVIITEIAKILSKKPLRKDIDFILMDGEECRLEGAKAYAKTVDTEQIDYLINVDGAGRGDVMELWCGYEKFERELIEYLDNDATFATKIYKNPPPPGSDNVPFYEKGINCVELTVNDQDLLHMPEDDYQPAVLENMKRLLPVVLKVIDMH